ncbi:putative SlyX family protein [Octadecabacter antarcticus 307]|uniref:Putative SlyX family protein n=1 Tax=Octadecabacter antarcticus 307 TaxID=391626 RepID=M9RHB6_9RHOB|nr:SlyX family protein [Octadecabacter antarcticus]AGI69235.1 putative SlyX family protein [Octadecabacter antarcticus 307]
MDQKNQERIAHLERDVTDLSDVVARQEGEIGRLTYRVQMLMEREAGREADAGGSAAMADQRPPHY